MNIVEQKIPTFSNTHQASWPVLICLLGNFLLLKAGQPVVLRQGGKIEILLAQLGLQHRRRFSRDALLQMLWPDSDAILASQSLHSLIYSLHKLTRDSIGDAKPVICDEGYYRLNVEAGIGVDVACFDALAKIGDQKIQAGDLVAGANAYRDAIELYRGDLCLGSDTQAIVERERLRSRYLSLLAYVADYHYREGDYAACKDYAWRLLVQDPCREDAHRIVMRCHVRQGERIQALRHYRLCADILCNELDTAPEPATKMLFEQIRLDPGNI